MKSLLPCSLAALALATAGCSTLPQHAAARGAEDGALFDVTEYVGAAKAEEHGANPGQQTVAWEDNGKPIRELTPEDGPQSMKVPHAVQRKNGKVVATRLADPPAE